MSRGPEWNSNLFTEESAPCGCNVARRAKDSQEMGVKKQLGAMPATGASDSRLVEPCNVRRHWQGHAVDGKLPERRHAE